MTDRDITHRIRLEAILTGPRPTGYVKAGQLQLVRYGESLFSAALHLKTAVAQMKIYARPPPERMRVK